MLNNNLFKRFLLSLAICCLFRFSGLSQESQFLNQVVSIKGDSITLDFALDKLAHQAACYFTYNAQLIDGSKKMNISFSKQPLKVILDSIIGVDSVSYVEYKNQIVISIPHRVAQKQNTSKKALELKGKIISSVDQSALSFATIAIKHLFIGTIANNSGEFQITIPDSCQNDTLIISFVGYYSKSIPVSQFQNKQLIELEPGVVSIPEIVVRDIQIDVIMKRVRENMKENYQYNPYGYEAFYREWVKKESNYLQYTEAILNGIKPRLQNPYATNKVAVKLSRKFSNIKNTDTVVVKIRGGIESCFDIDIVNAFPEFLSETGNRIYDYSLRNMLVFQNQLVYAVDFNANSQITEPLLEGTLFIDQQTYAIVGAEYFYKTVTLKKQSNLFVLKKSRDLKVKPLKTHYYVQYQQYNNKYYLSHIRGGLALNIKKKKDWFSKDFTTLIELVMTNIDTTANLKNTIHSDYIKTNTIFSDSKFEYEYQFWEQDQFILPEDDILEALKKSGLILKTTKSY